jgi:hypothetical protein
VAPQQPEFCPRPQSSPVGRQVEFGTSTSHWCVVALHTPEQHSEFAVHASPRTVQSMFEQTPPKHPSEQQSCAVVHATPFARHASRQVTTPAWPVTGSHRPLQHCGLDVQLVVGARHEPPPPPASLLGPATLPTQALPVHVPEQQSKPRAHAPPATLHAFVPPSVALAPPQTLALQAFTQHCEADVQPAPSVLQVAPESLNVAEPSSPAPPSSPVTTAALSLPPQLAVTNTAHASGRTAATRRFIHQLACMSAPSFSPVLRASTIACTHREPSRDEVAEIVSRRLAFVRESFFATCASAKPSMVGGKHRAG